MINKEEINMEILEGLLILFFNNWSSDQGPLTSSPHEMGESWEKLGEKDHQKS